MMEKIKCTIQYDGTLFAGFQIQPYQRTIQGEIERALQTIHKGDPIRIHGSGRTDTGVHAVAQVLHFETHLTINCEGWRQALNNLLPDDIDVLNVETVHADFHSRYSAVSKEYRYYVLYQTDPDVFVRNYSYHHPQPLDLKQMEAACNLFVGTHDFTSFASARSEAKGSRVRTLTEVSFKLRQNQIEFIIRGSGFLRHMVRIIIGSIIEVGRGERTPQELEQILSRKDRKEAGVTIPPQGLFLWAVTY